MIKKEACQMQKHKLCFWFITQNTILDTQWTKAESLKT